MDLHCFEFASLALISVLAPLAVVDIKMRRIYRDPALAVAVAGASLNTVYISIYGLTDTQIQHLLLSAMVLAVSIAMASAKRIGLGDLLVYVSVFCVDPFNKLGTAVLIDIPRNLLTDIFHMLPQETRTLITLSTVPPLPTIFASSLTLAISIHRFLLKSEEAPLTPYILISALMWRTIEISALFMLH